MEISVVIPTHNYGHYIRNALDSVFRQTFPVREVVVVDDGSTDDTRSRVEGTDSRIRYIYQRRQGPSAARNTGIKAARYRWIALLDADDWWANDKIEQQVQALRRTEDAVLAYASMTSVFPDGEQKCVPAFPDKDIWPMLRLANCITGSDSSVLVRRDVLLSEGGFREDLTACEDWDLWARLAMKYRFVSAPESMVYIRRHGASNSASPERLMAHTERIMESSLLAGLNGISRGLWRRRIRSAQLHSIATLFPLATAKQASYLYRSLATWPFPDVRKERWALAARLCVGEQVYGRIATVLGRTPSRPNHHMTA